MARQVKQVTRLRRDYKRQKQLESQYSCNNPRSITDVEDLISWAESTLIVPAGMRQGESFQFMDYQKTFLRGALGDPEVRQGGLSCPRKQGKSGGISALMNWALLHVKGFQGVVVSLDADRAILLRKEMEAQARASGIEVIKFRGGDTNSGSASVPAMGSHVEFIPASRDKSQGWKAQLSIIDEAGFLDESNRNLWYGMISSLSTNDDAKILAISVRGHGELFSEMAARKDDDDVFWLEFAAATNCDPYDETVWEISNPALDVIKSRKAMRSLARTAKLNPDALRQFLVYELNVPINPDIDVIMHFDEWLEHTGCTELPPRGGEAVIGWDLGNNKSMTAAAIYWPETGRLETIGQFPLDMTLAERGRADNVGSLYERAASEGELFQAGQYKSDLTRFLQRIYQIVGDAIYVTVYCDRWRDTDLRELMYREGLDFDVVYRGQGMKDGSTDVRAFREMVYEGNVKCLRSILLESAIAESKIQRDPAGNEKITRARQKGRIDMLQAVVLALAGGKTALAGMAEAQSIGRVEF